MNTVKPVSTDLSSYRGFFAIPVMIAVNPLEDSISFYIIWTFAIQFYFDKAQPKA